MIVGIKTERFITVRQHSLYGYLAYGIERSFELNSTKGWRPLRTRRQLIGKASKRDRHRALTQGASVSFKSAVLPSRLRNVETMRPTEKMMMRHAWYRRQKEREARAAATEAWNND